ncbi:MAG: chloride channel protein, partial [Polyangiales bacterium]
HLRNATVYYRDSEGKLHSLNAVEGDGLERAIALYFASEPGLPRSLLGQQGVAARWRLPTFSLAFAKMAASFLTLSSGGAGGLEASVTLVGESTAAGLFKPRGLGRRLPARVRHRLRGLAPFADFWRSSQPDDLQAAQLCGIAAAIATLLGTPFAAAFFAIEIIYRRRPIIDRLIYALVSALIAFFLTHIVTGSHSPFPSVAARPPIYEGRYYLALLAVAVSLGLLSSAFRATRGWADRAFHTRFTRPVLRHLAGAFITGAVAVVCAGVLSLLELSAPRDAHGARTPWLVLGTGENIITWALHGEFTLPVAVIALLGRFVATLSTITSGASAGLLFPTLCFGSLTAVCWASVFGLEPALLVIPAMTASLVSVANVPLAAILLVVEGFGAQWIVPAMFSLVWAAIFAHKNSIYRAQRETFDSGQILPGMSVRRIRVPRAWAGASLRALGVRERFGLTVIGMIDRRETPDGNIDERIVLNPAPDQLLTYGDLLIVLGEDLHIERFTRDSMPAPPPSSTGSEPT